MTPEERERQREANRLKNERRRRTTNKSGYAKAGRELRRAFGGSFGRAPAKTFNVCAEGTTVVRKPEADLASSSNEKR